MAEREHAKADPAGTGRGGNHVFRQGEVGAPFGGGQRLGLLERIRKPRKLTLSGGTIELRRPRVRNTDERFESRLLPLFAKRTAKVADLIP